ncbi:gephyrin-like molybdotransferase Glp [Rothia halotolerans]|uniref:molybdopterin molybdotransferase MoeA n=1 Tax=Rothia halotolerans TaxID=405770 RepID=UPI00101E0500|nr:gephyrin-like molybdotransferase Glp [Rothia halotolerans]
MGPAPREPREHLEHLVERLRRSGARPAAEQAALGEALGRTLAEDLHAMHDSPRFDNSQMDGYALSREQNEAADRRFTAGPPLPAGTDPEEAYPRGLGDREVCPIMTGAALPDGAVAVVPVEHCVPPEFVERGAEVRVPAAEPGRFVRRAGEDLGAGALLLRAGERLNPQALASAAGQGLRELPVRRLPRVLLCTGGEELVSAGETAGPAQIPDANGPLLEALCAVHGLRVVGRLRTGDDPEALGAALREAIAASAPDLIVTSGGVGHGRYEVVRRLLEGAEGAWFGHVAQQPGGPQGLGTFEGVPVAALPGNPISTLVSFRLFVVPAAARAWGAAPEPPRLRARICEDAAGLPGRTCFLRGRLELGENGLRVRPVGGRGSHLLAQALPADCLIEIPPDDDVGRGDPVTVHPLEGSGPAGATDMEERPEGKR